MQCKAQSYWHTEYQFHKNYTVDTPANNNYQKFAKRQYHKARRRHDRQIIGTQLDELHREIALLNEIFNTDNQPFIYV